MRNFEFMKHFWYILLLFTAILIGCKNRTTITTSSEARVNTFNFYTDTLNPGLTEATYKINHNGDTGRIYCVDSLRFKTCLIIIHRKKPKVNHSSKKIGIFRRRFLFYLSDEITDHA